MSPSGMVPQIGPFKDRSQGRVARIESRVCACCPAGNVKAVFICLDFRQGKNRQAVHGVRRRRINFWCEMGLLLPDR
jgi:hypothetical protein